MSVKSREEATAIINKILTKNGGIRPEIKAQTPAESLEALESVRQQLAEATETMTENLYSTSTRFVLELIQNADDNQYKTIAANGQEPDIKFSVYFDRIVVDCNEDGFRTDDVHAICSLGGSTKKGSEGYIGEKGIGFKSVFKVANRVHIQSGYFSFVFEHQKGDRGLWMITPLEEPHDRLPEGVTTRMVLFIRDTSKLSQIVQEFTEIPSTLLLFLRKVKKFTVKVDTGRDVMEIQHRYRYDDSKRLATLTRISTHDGITTRNDHLYVIESKKVRKLPSDKARKNINHAEVLLAFPIDETGSPVIENQYSFAFLPLRKHGFKFIMQSDFVTQANREDVFDSSWNEKLLNGVAETFTAAVINFTADSTKYEKLQYSWPKYVPDESIADSFWSRLQPMILGKLKEARIFRSWSGKNLKRSSTLRRVVPLFQDQKGKPLLEDLDPELYVSPNYYKEVSISVMNRLGVEAIRWPDVKSRLEADIAYRKSRLKDSSTEDDWHTKLAEMLLTMAKTPIILHELKTIPLIPIQSGVWVSSKDTKVYFPTSTVDGVAIPIPGDIGVTLVRMEAAANNSRSKLFQMLGVENRGSKDVVNDILRCTPNSATHIRYLYYFLAEPEKSIGDPRHSMQLIDTRDRSFPATTGYLQSSEYYSAERLFGSDYDAHFLHPSYLAAVSRDTRYNGRTFLEWLVHLWGLTEFPRLIPPTSNSEEDISKDFNFILKHRAGDLLGTLKTHWNHYQGLITAPVAKVIAETSVPCENGSWVSLSHAYFPSEILQKRAGAYGVCDKLNFLKLPFATPQPALTTQWELLNCFGIKRDMDLNFHIELLAHVTGCPRIRRELGINLITKLYESIARRCESDDEIERVQEFFSSTRAIRITADFWVLSTECLWSTPYEMDTKISLCSMEEYHGVFLILLFRHILKCSDLTWEQSIDYLEELKDRFPDGTDGLDSEVLLGVYRHIEKEVDRIEESNDGLLFERTRLILQGKFTGGDLVYIPSTKEWKMPELCLWTHKTNIIDKRAIKGEYEMLSKLFQIHLGIKPPGISMLVDEIKNLSEESTTTSQTHRAKELIHEVNEMKPDALVLHELRSCRFLPVRSSEGVELLYSPSNSSSFFVIDKPQHETAFKKKVRSLSFSVSEIRQLRPFISAIGIENRYTTSLVTEASEAEGGSVDVELTNDMRNRAYAMLRCAVHFQAPNTQKESKLFYNVVKNSIVFKSDHISKTITLEQHEGNKVTVEAHRCNLHLTERDSVLNFYVPKDEVNREQCYMQQIPQKMVSYMGIDTAAESFLIRVLTARSAAALEASLTEDGISHVGEIPPSERKPIPYMDPITESVYSSSNLVDLTRDSQEQANDISVRLQPSPQEHELMEIDTPQSSQSHQTRSLTTQNNESVRPSTDIRVTRASQSDTRARSYIPSPGASHKRRRSRNTIDIGSNSEIEDHAEAPTPSDTTYVQFLQRIIYVAQTVTLSVSRADTTMPWIQSAVEPGAECFNDSSFAPELACGDRSRDRSAHDKKLGAAGELYAYVLLSNLNLLGFSIDNWQSKIRKEICVHEAYKDIQEWIGNTETADFTYTDTTGTLTNRLLESGHLSGNYWKNAKPLYCIEVKTTLKGPEEPFYVSKGQYKRMLDSRIYNPGLNPITKVYIIFRVFNAGKRDTGMRIFVDPATLEEENKLQFGAENYLVHPVNQPSAPRRSQRTPGHRQRP